MSELLRSLGLALDAPHRYTMTPKSEDILESMYSDGPEGAVKAIIGEELTDPVNWILGPAFAKNLGQFGFTAIAGPHAERDNIEHYQTLYPTTSSARRRLAAELRTAQDMKRVNRGNPGRRVIAWGTLLALHNILARSGRYTPSPEGAPPAGSSEVTPDEERYPGVSGWTTKPSGAVVPIYEAGLEDEDARAAWKEQMRAKSTRGR